MVFVMQDYYIKKVLNSLSEKTNTLDENEQVLHQIALLSDSLRKQGKLTDEYRNQILEEVERRTVARQ